MAATLSEISNSCRVIRNAAPREWEKFKEAFSKYSAQATDDVTEADAAQIMTIKGRAQQCKALLRVFNECDLEPKQPAP